MSDNYDLNEKNPKFSVHFTNLGNQNLENCFNQDDQTLENNFNLNDNKSIGKNSFQECKILNQNLDEQYKLNIEEKDDFDSSTDFCTIDTSLKSENENESLQNEPILNKKFNYSSLNKNYNIPPKKSELSAFIQSPISKTLDTFSKISQFLTKDDYASFKSSLSLDEDFDNYFKVRTNVQNQKYQFNQKFPPPSLPEIKTSISFHRYQPLKMDEFEEEYKLKSVKCVAERIFLGGIYNNDLRKKLWPVLLGIKKSWEDDDWSNEEKLYKLYLMQWSSITPDQESRFTVFKDFKLSAERDVIRCDRDYEFFKKQKNIDLLNEILMCYIMYDFNTGYVQGMTDLAAPFLLIYEGDPIKSFWCFTSVLNFTKNNFEMSQKTVKNLLKMLFKLINLTDPCFAQYLNSNESANCYFAFRWLICLFKREFFKKKTDNYNCLLIIWDTFWALNAYQQIVDEEASNEASNKTKNMNLNNNENFINCTKDNLLGTSPPFIISCLDNKEDIKQESNCNNSVNNEENILTNIELFFLAMSLAIIRQERDIIFSKKLDASEILKHFNTLYLSETLETILRHSTKIWYWLKYDGGEEQLYKEQKEEDTNDSKFKLDEPFDLLNDDSYS